MVNEKNNEGYVFHNNRVTPVKDFIMIGKETDCIIKGVYSANNEKIGFDLQELENTEKIHKYKLPKKTAKRLVDYKKLNDYISLIEEPIRAIVYRDEDSGTERVQGLIARLK